MINRNKVLNLLGLATKAGKLQSGEFSAERSVKCGKATLVIVSEDASENTKKMFRDMCAHYKVPLYLFGEKEELGHAMGKEERSSVAVQDTGFSKAIEKLLNMNGGSEYEGK